MITHIFMFLFKTFDSKPKNIESTERRKTSFPKQIVENAEFRFYLSFHFVPEIVIQDITVC